VHPVRPTKNGQIGPVVHNKQRIALAGQLTQQPGPLEQLAIVERLVAKLQHVHAGAHERPGQRRELLLRRPTVDQHVEPCPVESLAAIPGDLHRAVEGVAAVSEPLQPDCQLRIEHLAELFERAERLFQSREVGRQHVAGVLATLLGRNRYAGPHVGLGFPGGQASAQAYPR